MSGRLRSYLELVRLPNTFTAAADVVAGFLYAGGNADRWASTAALAAASALLYGGGAALNDVCDAERDARERPSRPIPSGRIGRAAALRCSVVLLIAGSGAAAMQSARAAGVAGLLTLFIVLYNALFKTRAVAPALMGACRGLNLSLGLISAPSAALANGALPVALMWTYVASLTVFARREATAGRRGDLVLGTLGVCSAIVGLAGLASIGAMRHPTALAPIAVLALALGTRGLAAVRRPQPDAVQRAVKTFVLSIVLFDAGLVWSSRGPAAALVVVLFLLPAVLLARRFRVT